MVTLEARNSRVSNTGRQHLHGSANRQPRSCRSAPLGGSTRTRWPGRSALHPGTHRSAGPRSTNHPPAPRHVYPLLSSPEGVTAVLQGREKPFAAKETGSGEACLAPGHGRIVRFRPSIAVDDVWRPTNCEFDPQGEGRDQERLQPRAAHTSTITSLALVGTVAAGGLDIRVASVAILRTG